MAAGIGYVRICSLGLILGASSSVLGNLQGGGLHHAHLWAGFIANWLVKLPMAAIGTLVLGWPVDGIWWAIALSVVVEWLIPTSGSAGAPGWIQKSGGG